jgi:omega-6 fatty acid desaturase (delta-12 desaturase)
MNTKERKMETPVRWQPLVAKYQTPEIKRSLWQLATSVIPYLFMWYVMIRSLQVGYWLTLLLAIPTAGFMVRNFIIFHDCGHGSFFKSNKANEIVGYLTGILAWTPYYYWRHEHAIHHATAGDLDRRGTGDVFTMTVAEYLAAPWWKKAGYRIMRNPLILFTIGSFIVFAVTHRFWIPGTGKRERNSVIITNLALLVIVAGLIWLIGWKAFLMIQIPVMFIASSAGVWLFYVQHNFDGTYWERHDKWEFVKAGINGSSFYRLPGILQWFTGNIGFHHIHHLSPKIPNYKLEKCHNENPLFQIEPLTFRDSLNGLYLRLWDEKEKIMVGWRAIKKYKMNIQMNKM